ncbi:MAG: outer membrane lipoprotein-sorting protein [Candidatus Atribacteria bacterium]|nr:outer membrane lipoprotein-sorting protein [Candidatus Atribacteria bacterium]
MKKLVMTSFLLIVLMAFSFQAFAITADEILDEMEAKSALNATQKSVGTMILTDEKGKEEKRELVMYAYDDSEDTENRAFIFRFLSPAEVRNVTMLSMEDGEQIYLFMPAFKKVRRIAGSGKKEKFAGTNISFEDLSGGYSKDDYDATLVGEDEENYLLDLVPADPDSDYSKLIMTVDKEKFYFKKIEFLDLEGNLWKVLEVQKVQEEEDGSVTILKMYFQDLKDNTTSLVEFESVEKGIDLPNNFFSVRTIQQPEI